MKDEEYVGQEQAGTDEQSTAPSSGLASGITISDIARLQEFAGTALTRIDPEAYKGILTAAESLTASTTAVSAVAGLRASDLSIGRLAGMTSALQMYTDIGVARLGISVLSDDMIKNLTVFATHSGVLDNLPSMRLVQAGQLAATAGIADLIKTDSILSNWRQNMLLESTARTLAQSASISALGHATLDDIIGVNSAMAGLLTSYAERNAGSVLAAGASAPAARALRHHLTRLPVDPTDDDLNLGALASRGVAGITAADLFLAPGSLDSDALELVEEEVVDPWVNGPQEARAQMMARLADIEPTAHELLQAAWIQINRNDPGAASLAAHAVVETIDRTLRAAAPNDDVLTAAQTGRLGKNATHNKDGRPHPTRRGRIAFILHRHGPVTSMITAQTDALSSATNDLMRQLQSGKHASNVNIVLVRAHLMSVEAILVQLLVAPD